MTVKNAPSPASLRFRVDPGDVPAAKAARRLHLTEDRFLELLPRLLTRGFPPADPDTGMFDLEAIDAWRRSRSADATRYPQGGGLTGARLSPDGPSRSLGDRFVEAQQRRQATERKRYG